jgi:hypothetical protein
VQARTNFAEHAGDAERIGIAQSVEPFDPQNGIRQRGLIPYVVDQSGEDLDEMAFTDGINRNLRLGRLLLLIVGEGIREGVEEMNAYLQHAPNRQFTPGLVEIWCSSVTAGPRASSTLLVPRVVMRTVEFTRATLPLLGV